MNQETFREATSIIRHQIIKFGVAAEYASLNPDLRRQTGKVRSSTNLGGYGVYQELGRSGSVRNTCTADQLRTLEDTHMMDVGEFRV